MVSGGVWLVGRFGGAGGGVVMTFTFWERLILRGGLDWVPQGVQISGVSRYSQRLGGGIPLKVGISLFLLYGDEGCYRLWCRGQIGEVSGCRD